MTRYTLTYFDVRGLAEPVRLLFAFAGVPFEDRGVSDDEWARLKPDSPLGQMPFLTVHDAEGQGHRIIPEMMSIVRYLAKTHELAGKTEDEWIAADVASEAAIEARAALVRFRSSPESKDEAAKARYLEEIVPIHFQRMEKLLGSHSWFSGAATTYADFIVFDALERHANMWPKALLAWPRLDAFKKRVESLPELQAYFRVRRPA
ncbi:MAG: glutathione S-transferase family protein [Deltaproteobacteria bacterium]|nr:glutathione S-transferase family protein [Deltaproteobacteria bacterium]